MGCPKGAFLNPTSFSCVLIFSCVSKTPSAQFGLLTTISYLRLRSADPTTFGASSADSGVIAKPPNEGQAACYWLLSDEVLAQEVLADMVWEQFRECPPASRSESEKPCFNSAPLLRTPDPPPHAHGARIGLTCFGRVRVSCATGGSRRGHPGNPAGDRSKLWPPVPR